MQPRKGLQEPWQTSCGDPRGFCDFLTPTKWREPAQASASLLVPRQTLRLPCSALRPHFRLRLIPGVLADWRSSARSEKSKSLEENKVEGQEWNRIILRATLNLEDACEQELRTRNKTLQLEGCSTSFEYVELSKKNSSHNTSLQFRNKG